MPSYKQSKSQKRSQSQSKNGGRRRKHTVRKLRRGKKSRKVMRGGSTKISYERFKQLLTDNSGTMEEFLRRYNMTRKRNVSTWDQWKKDYDEFGNSITYNEISNMIGYNGDEVETVNMSKLMLSFRTLPD